MHFRAVAATSFLSAAVANAIPASSTYCLHAKRNFAPNKIVKRSRVSSDATPPMRIGLSQSDLHKCFDYIMDVANTSSPNIGKHWTAEEVNRAFMPATETVQAVRDWLVAAGISGERISLADNHVWLAFDAATEEAERLLHTEFHEQYLEGSGKRMLAVMSKSGSSELDFDLEVP